MFILNINETLEKKLCMGCGICAGVCGKNAIKFKFDKGFFKPNIDNNKCVNCNMCFECCPGIKVDVNMLSGNNYKKENFVKGNTLKSYSGKIKDNELIKECTSGGVITGIVQELLKKGIVDYAAVLKYDEYNNEPAYIELTNDISNVEKSAKSKYLPSNISKVISYIIKNREKRYVVVGTSCQIQGVRYVINKYKLNKDNIILLGLFCDKTLNYNFIKYYEDVFGNGEKIKLAYRTKEKSGWPGDSKVTLSNTEEIHINKKLRMSLKEVFQLTRCRYCIDKLNQFSDISFGDCYNKGEGDIEGKSSILVRTDLGRKVIELCRESLILEEADIEKVVKSQNINEKLEHLDRANKLNIYSGLGKIATNKTSIKSNIKFRIKNTLGERYSLNPKLYRYIISKVIVKKNTDEFIID